MCTAEVKPVSKIVIERKPKLLARFHQTEHDIARNTAIAAHCATRDLPLRDKGPQVILRCVGVQRDTGMLRRGRSKA